MDLSQFVHKLTPPPEELVQNRDCQGVFCPIFVPSLQATVLQSEPFEFCGCQVYLIEPELGISEDGQTTFSPELVKGGRLIELTAMSSMLVCQSSRKWQERWPETCTFASLVLDGC